MLIIKHSTDGEGIGGGGLSILEQDTSGVDTSYPLIPASLQDFEIIEVSVGQNSKQTGDNIIIKMKTTKDVRAAGSGDLIPAGFPVTTRISLTETDKLDTAGIKKNVAKFTQAIGVKTVSPFEQCAGKLATVKVTIQPAKDGFDEQNRFAFVPLAKAK